MICLKCNQVERDTSGRGTAREERWVPDATWRWLWEPGLRNKTPSTAVLYSSSRAGLDDHPITLPFTPSCSLVHLTSDPITRRRTRRGPPHYVINLYPLPHTSRIILPSPIKSPPLYPESECKYHTLLRSQVQIINKSWMKTWAVSSVFIPISELFLKNCWPWVENTSYPHCTTQCYNNKQVHK